MKFREIDKGILLDTGTQVHMSKKMNLQKSTYGTYTQKCKYR